MDAQDCPGYPYPSRRTVVFARNGMVAASQPLAAQAGLEMLKKGGNAVDAAERSFPAAAMQALRDRGHLIETAPEGAAFGRGQVIRRDHSSGVLAGGTDPRADSAIAAW